jgi:glutathione synthase/RimK-type ligase-like ATP-grasp enzyme
MKEVVVLSHENDAHIEYVQRHLDRRLICIDASKILQKVELSYDSKGVDVIFDGKKLSSVGAVWYRKPTPLRDLLFPVAEAYREYVEDSYTYFTNALKASFQDAFWLCDYYAILKASNKPWQMQVASRLGFTVPDTLITSSVSAAERFIDSHEKVIVKTLAPAGPMVNGTTLMVTTRLTSADKKDLKGLHLAPSIFQVEIDTEFEIRVTVVGEEIFAAAIKDKGIDDMEFIRDWRATHLIGRARFVPYKLSSQLADKCLRLVKAMKLEFGAIDLIMDKKGVIWFLEINPNGQWAFVEEETKQPIGRAIANLLVARADEA